MKGQPKRDWSAARAKVEAEGRCRTCGRGEPGYRIEAAHTLARSHDKKDAYRVAPARVVPLCKLCHGAYDRHELDLWSYLDISEQGQAVEDAGGFWLAVKRTAPLAYRQANEVAA